MPAHPRRLISAFVFCLLESIISKLATSILSIFYDVSATEQAGLGIDISETWKTGFLASQPNYCSMLFNVHQKVFHNPIRL